MCVPSTVTHVRAPRRKSALRPVIFIPHGVQSPPLFNWPSPLLDGGGDDVAVFGPTAVVVLHIVKAEEIFEDKPGMAGALPDAAISNGVFFGIDALLLYVNLLQLVRRFES